MASKKNWPSIIGECYHCKEQKELVQRFKHRNNICEDCKKSRQKEYAKKQAIKRGQRIGEMGRYPYPLQGWDYMQQKFRSLAYEMKRTENREEHLELIRRNLDDTLNNAEVMEWIKAHDAMERKEEQKKRGEFKKRQENDLKDTRNMNWDDFDDGGWGDDIDS